MRLSKTLSSLVAAGLREERMRFPQACRVVLALLAQVVDHDEAARDQQMSPPARLAYHQAMSRPLLETLNRWLETQMAERLVAPNSALGTAIASLQHHWET